jgi:hypothetical protein
MRSTRRPWVAWRPKSTRSPTNAPLNFSGVEARRLKRGAARGPGHGGLDAAAGRRTPGSPVPDVLRTGRGSFAAPSGPRDPERVAPGGPRQRACVPGRGRFGWRWDANPRSLDRLLWPLARDAAVASGSRGGQRPSLGGYVKVRAVASGLLGRQRPSLGVTSKVRATRRRHPDPGSA